MTSSEWLSCGDPEAMLAFLKGRASPRKLRLFAVACCGPFRHMLVPETAEMLEVAEAFAGGRVGQDERRAARARAFQAGWHPDEAFRHRRGPAKSCVTSALARQAHWAAVRTADYARHIGLLSKTDWPSSALETDLVRHSGTVWAVGGYHQASGEEVDPEEEAEALCVLRPAVPRLGR